MNALTLVLLASAVPAAADDSPLAGRWWHKADTQTITLTILPDGRYFSETKAGDKVIADRGKYRVMGEKFVLDPIAAGLIIYQHTLEGAALLLTTKDGNKLEYKRTATAAEVAAEAVKADAAKAKEDAVWRERIAVATMKRQPKFVPVPPVKEDPEPKRVFQMPEVFVKEQIYLWEKPAEYVFEDGKLAGRFKTYQRFHFLPNGRVYFEAATCTGTVEVPPALRGTLPTFYATKKREGSLFGEYRLEKEKLVIDYDGGEAAYPLLIDGRRNLVFQREIFANVTAEFEAMRKKKK